MDRITATDNTATTDRAAASLNASTRTTTEVAELKKAELRRADPNAALQAYGKIEILGQDPTDCTHSVLQPGNHLNGGAHPIPGQPYSHTHGAGHDWDKHKSHSSSKLPSHIHQWEKGHKPAVQSGLHPRSEANEPNECPTLPHEDPSMIPSAPAAKPRTNTESAVPHFLTEAAVCPANQGWDPSNVSAEINGQHSEVSKIEHAILTADLKTLEDEIHSYDGHVQDLGDIMSQVHKDLLCNGIVTLFSAGSRTYKGVEKQAGDITLFSAEGGRALEISTDGLYDGIGGPLKKQQDGSYLDWEMGLPGNPEDLLKHIASKAS